MGNISVPSVTLPQSSGANSVNVSLSGSTLTVNVDGHRDSVDISSAIQNREFSISFPNKGYSDGVMIGGTSRTTGTTSNLYEWNQTIVSKIECPFGTSQAYISSLNNLVNFISLSRGNSGQEGLRITSINNTSENIVVSGSGSGTVRIYGYFYVYTYNSGGYVYTTSSKPYLELTIEDGSLSSVSSNLYCMSGYPSLSLNGIESVTLQ